MRKPLVLVPTLLEQQILADEIQPAIHQAGGTLHLCGFGPIAAAARTSQLLADIQPECVVLAGIAGTLHDGLSVGSAWIFDEVACYGVGVGTGDSFTSAAKLGWHQWAGTGGDDSLTRPATDASDVLKLANGNSVVPDGGSARAMQLLTCCAGSGSHNDVELKKRSFPNAVAEDMEGFGVAMACSLANVPLTIVRGISNVAGERNKQDWQIDQALDAAAQHVVRLIAEDDQHS